MEDNIYYPRILITTASCIGNSLDNDELYHVAHVGFPAIIVDAVQEMGRCDRNCDVTSADIDEYTIIGNLEDFIYMNQWLYSKNEDKESSKKRFISLEVDRKNQHFDLMNILRV